MNVIVRTDDGAVSLLVDDIEKHSTRGSVTLQPRTADLTSDMKPEIEQAVR